MSATNKPVDPFSLGAGIPPAPVEGELVPKPKVSIGMSRKVVVAIVALVTVFLVLFLASIDKMDQDIITEGKERKISDDVAGQLPVDLRSSAVGAVNKPPEVPLPPEMPKPTDGKPGNAVPALGGLPPNSPTTPGAPPPLSPEEQRAHKLQEDRANRLMLARLSGLEVKNYAENSAGKGAAASRPDDPLQSANAAITSLLSGMTGAKTPMPGPSAGSSGFPGGGMPGGGAANDQDEKRRFIATAGGENGRYLEHTVMPPLSSTQLNAGAYVPAILEMAVNSDLPGQVTARVRENVYASVNENCLLLPSGSQLVGTYSSKVALGQARQLVVWNRVFFPNGHELNLAGMPSADLEGQAGLNADVDNHWLRLFGVTLGMSAVTAGVQLSVGVPATSADGVTAAPTAAQTVSTALSQQFGQLGAQLFGRYLNIQPTLRNYPGERFNVVVPKNIVFPRCYSR